MLRITTKDGHDCPQAFCESCGKSIGLKDWVYWRNAGLSSKKMEGHSGNPLFLHDSSCVLAAKPSKHFSCMTLKEFLHYLKKNASNV